MEENVIGMMPGVVYNVSKGDWHPIAISPDAAVLVIGSGNTTRENTERREV